MSEKEDVNRGRGAIHENKCLGRVHSEASDSPSGREGVLHSHYVILEVAL